MLLNSKLFAESWNVAWRKKAQGTILTDKETPFTVIKNSFRYWAADPFIFEYDGKAYIFAELYDYVNCRGCLGYCELNEKRVSWKPVIEEAYHLSYPCIFRSGQEIYIMPESGAGDELVLYKAIRFPNQWEKVRILRRNVRYGDTTPFEWKNHKYALAYDVKEAGKYKMVLLDFENEDQDKALSVSDIESRRPAGMMFRSGDKNIRVAQNCRHGYGKGLIFYEYWVLENGIYTEELLESIFPEQLHLSKSIYADGMHTYNGSEHYEVIDIKTRRFNVLNFIFRIFGKLKR